MINLYPLQKTLCFELKPVGLTLEHFKTNKIDKKAKDRAEEFKQIKHLIDDIHIDIIESGLKSLASDSLFIKRLKLHEKYRAYYIDSCKNLYKEKETLNEAKDKLNAEKKQLEDDRRQNNEKAIKKQEPKVKELQEEFNKLKAVVDNKKNIVDETKEKKEENDQQILILVKRALKSNDKYEKIFSEEKCELLKEYYKNDSEKMKLIDHFSDFISYFNKYDSRIKNLYGSKKISTTYKSIGYRLITDNLPIFQANIEKIKDIEKITKTILFKKNFRAIENFANYLTTEDIDSYNKEIDKINIKIDDYNKKATNKLSYLGRLYILVDLDQDSDILKRISDDKELIEIINNFISRVNLQNFKDYFGDLKKYDPKTTYIQNSKSLQDACGDDLVRKIRNVFKQQYISFDSVVNYEYKNDSYRENNTNSFFSAISNLADKLFNNYKEKYANAKDILFANYESDIKILARSEEKKLNILAKIKELLESEDNKSKKIVEQIKSLFKSEDNILTKIKELLESEDNKSNKIIEQVKKILEPENSLLKIKDLLEAIKALSRFVSWFVPKVKKNKDYTNFFKVNFKIYNELQPEKFAKIDQIYSHVRAYFSLKNFSTRKIRLNFDAKDCLKNWNLQEIDENLGTIFRRKENGKTKYYLGIVNKDKFKEEFSKFYVKDSKNVYEQMVYEKHSDSDFSINFKNVSEKTINEMIENDKLYFFQIYNQDFSECSRGNVKLHTKYWNNIFDDYNTSKEHSDTLKRFNINGEAKLFYRPQSLPKKVTHPEGQDIRNKNEKNPKKTSNFGYPLIKDKRYTEDKFLFHVSIDINDEYACEFTKNGQKKKNIQNQLNKKILNKIQNGKILNIIGISRSRDDLLRATVIDLNGDIKESVSLSTIKSECFDKNNKKKTFEQDYNKLLNEKEKEREEASNANNNNKATTIQNISNDKTIMKEWQSARSIKDFKNGYISQAVNEIAKLVVKYDAIVVFEDLDGKSEKIDSKIEKSMYEKLEKALVTKLSFLVTDKKLLPKQPGSSFKGYQLTYYEEKEKHRTEGKKSQTKQNGIIFYVPTNLTSNIDSNTGFINCFAIPKNVDDMRDFIGEFHEIKKVVGDKEHYEFSMFYKYFKKNDFLRNDLIHSLGELVEKFLDKKWIVYSNGEFLSEKGFSEQSLKELDLINERWEKVVEKEENDDLAGLGFKKYTYKKVNLKEEFEELFETYSQIKQVKKENILEFAKPEPYGFKPTGKGMNRLINNQRQKVKDPKEEFVRKFVRLLSLMFQMRNYDKNNDYEYIISPVSDENNKFFVSKADENVSKNIAKKGLFLVNKIKNGEFDLKIKDEDWINYIVGSKFSSNKKKRKNDKKEDEEIDDSNWFNHIDDSKNKKY